LSPQAPANGTSPAIEVSGIGKTYGSVEALKGVDLSVPYGSIRGLLGPNGAGKTTLVRLLTTLLEPSFGSARVHGFDVVKDASRLRRVIGLAGQNAAVDENLTGRENLTMVGRLYHLGTTVSRKRADELLDRFALSDAASRTVKQYSGGMRRRLDLAASMVAKPAILFLDEPTTGLDPRSRLELWDVIRELVDEGTTVLLTTQYMDEADRLADVITVIDRGAVIAEGTSTELKGQCGGTRLTVQVADRGRVEEARTVAEAVGLDTPVVQEETGQVVVTVDGGASSLTEAVRRLDAAGIAISDIGLRQPTLDDVFLALTGQQLEGDGTEIQPTGVGS
jgi:ABC-2 type transport system ATP-binding protein